MPLSLVFAIHVGIAQALGSTVVLLLLIIDKNFQLCYTVFVVNEQGEQNESPKLVDQFLPRRIQWFPSRHSQ